MPFEAGVYGLAVSLNGQMLAFSTVTADGFHLYSADLAPDGTVGARRVLYQDRALGVGPRLSADGTIALLAVADRGEGMRYRLLALDTATGHAIAALEDPGASVLPAGFAPIAGDARVLATTDRGGYGRPLIWDVRTGYRVDFPADAREGDLSPVDWSFDGARVALRRLYQTVPRLSIWDVARGEARELPHAPYGRIWGGFFGPDGGIYANCDTAARPFRAVEMDTETGAERRVALAIGADLPGHPVRSITFRSSDGQEVQGWLTLPDGPGPFPAILETHGGPDNFMTGGYYPFGQAWADHGFAFLTINYRGSTTFGRAFMEQIWGDVGHWEVEDMVTARAWLVDEGVARPDGVFLTGRSYGGILTLLALGTHPELWAGGMAVSAVADLALAYEDESDALKAYDVALFKGTPEQAPAVYRAGSPVTYVERVAAPVLIIQGRNDTRCPPRSIEIYEERLRALGKPIEVYWYDAGHWTSDVAERIHHQELMLRFARAIAGRE
jgi:dipeptidyl aminopeptidase/acylaminoacyl peptidase